MAINFQLLRSSTASKRPTAANLDTGELGLNFNSSTSGLFFENASGNIMKVGPAEVGSTAPNASPAAGGSTGNSQGELWYDTSNSLLKVFVATEFVPTIRGITSAANANAIAIDANEKVTLKGALEVDGLAEFEANVQFGTGFTAGVDVLFYGASNNSLLTWDASADSLVFGASTTLTVPDGNLTLGGAAVTSTAVELNRLDGVVPGTVGAAKAVVVNTNDDISGFRNVSLVGELDTATLDVSSTSAFADNLTVENAKEFRFSEATTNGTNFTGFKAPAALTADVTFTLPNGDGTSGQTILTDGSGTLSWGSGSVAGIVSSANATAITIGSNEQCTFSQSMILQGTDLTSEANLDFNINDNQAQSFRVLTGATELVRVTTTDGSEKVDVSTTLQLDGAVDINGAVDCSGDITFSDSQTIRVTDNLGFALRILEGTDEYMRVITTDGNESIQFDKAVVISDTLVFNSGAFLNGSIDFSLQPANSNALDFSINGGNNMMRFNTNTETVLVPVAFEVDGTATFDGAMDIDSTVDISGGEVTLSLNTDIQIVDNSAQALDIAEGANNYMRFITLDGSEEIEVYQAVELKAENISMTNTAGVDLTLIDNFGSALTIKSADGANYQSFKTSNSEPQVQFLQDVLILNGKKFTFNNVEIDAIQTGSETFADNDTSLMTSAAVKDLVDSVSGVTQSEGNFTATFRGSTAEPGSLVTTTGYFVQVGKMVTATIDTGAVSWTGYGGVATVTGMPATSKSGFDFVGSFHSTGGLFESSNNDGMVCHMDGNTTVLDLRAQDSAVAPTWSPSGIDTIMFTITYFTA